MSKKKITDLPKELTDKISGYLKPKQNANLYSTSKNANKRFEADKCYILLQKVKSQKIDIPVDICNHVPKNELVPFFEQYMQYKMVWHPSSRCILNVISVGYFSLFKYIINHGKNEKIFAYRDDNTVYNYTDLNEQYLQKDPHKLLSMCATYDKLDMLKFLLSKNFNLHANNEAALEGSLNNNFVKDRTGKITEFLISKGAVVNQRILTKAKQFNTMHFLNALSSYTFSDKRLHFNY